MVTLLTSVSDALFLIYCNFTLFICQGGGVFLFEKILKLVENEGRIPPDVREMSPYQGFYFLNDENFLLNMRDVLYMDSMK